MGHVPFATDESGKTVYLCLGYVRIATQAHLSEHIGLVIQWRSTQALQYKGAGEDTADAGSGTGASAGASGTTIDTGASVRAAGTTTGTETTSSLHSGALSATVRLDTAENLPAKARKRATEAAARTLAAVGEPPVVMDTCAFVQAVLAGTCPHQGRLQRRRRVCTPLKGQRRRDRRGAHARAPRDCHRTQAGP